MATFLVTTSDDIVDSSDGVLSLREAINQANGTAAADTILFADNLEGATLRITEGSLSVTNDLQINRDSENNIRIDHILFENQENAAFNVQAADFAIENLTFGVSGSAIFASDSSVSVSDTVFEGIPAGDFFYSTNYVSTPVIDVQRSEFALSGSTILGIDGFDASTIISSTDSQVHLINSTIGDIFNDYAVAIEATQGVNEVIVEDSNIINVGTNTFDRSGAILIGEGELTVKGSYIGNAGLESFLDEALAIDTAATTIIENSTINRTSSSTENEAGSIVARPGAELSLLNVTIAGAADFSSPGDSIEGILLQDGATLTVTNSIIDATIDGAVTSGGNNVFTQSSIGNLSETDQIFNGLEGLFARTDEGVAIAANNGGPSRTIELLDDPDNPAINGANSDIAPDTDQRGFERVDGPDIGSFELQEGEGEPSSGTIVTTAEDIVAADGQLSLREAILFANETEGEQTITFADDLAGETITVSTGGIFFISDDLTIEGSGQEIVADNSANLFVAEDSTISIFNVNLTRGDIGPFPEDLLDLNSSSLILKDSDLDGGGINIRGASQASSESIFFNLDGVSITNSLNNLTVSYFGAESSISNSQFIGNESGLLLIGVPSEDANPVTIENSVIAENREGIISYANLTVRNTVIRDNGAEGINDVGYFGSIKVENSAIINNSAVGLELFGAGHEITNSTIAGNNGGGINLNNGGLEVLNSTITSNIATNGNAGGIEFDDDSSELTLNNTIVVGNEAVFNGQDYFEENLSVTRFSGENNLIGDSYSILENNNQFSITAETIFAETELIQTVAGGVAAANGSDIPSVALIATANNPALNNANPNLAPETDQRGLERVGAPDIGSFELQEEIDSGFPDLNLVEGEAVDPARINGVDPDILIGSDDTISITFLSQIGDFNNSLGYYTYDEDGEIEDVGLLFEGDNQIGAGDQFELDQIEAGEQFGLFLIQDGQNRNPDISTDSDFLFVERGGRGEASIFDETPADLIFSNSEGLFEIDGTILHALNIDGENPLNPRNGLSALSEEQDGALFVAFEDKNPGSSSNDSDFNDLVIRIDGLIPMNTSGYGV